jgi:hypothetical protein
MLDPLSLTRRAFLGHGAALGTAALASLLCRELRAEPGVIRPLHFPPKAKRVIWLYMSGGPSHLETFDNKPELAKMDGRSMPESFTKGQPIAQLQGAELRCLGPQARFRKHGKSGQEISDLFPYLVGVADELCILRGLHTEQINHDPAHMMMNTGTALAGRPSMGSWVTYGLGSLTDDLPAFVVMTSFEGGRSPQPIAARQWHSGFLPGRYQGVHFRSQGDPVLYLRAPDGVTDARQRDVVDAVESLNRLQDGAVADPEIGTRIAQYEMAFKMQTSVPKLVDFADEPRAVLERYGVEKPDGTYAANCLLARRLAERGVRFIQLYHRDWDHHGDLVRYIRGCAKSVDRATTALLCDLKERGLLEDTLVIWGGEFGRTPMFQGKGKEAGRDHHIRGFSMWLAGAGIKPGITHGKTDELGYYAVEGKVHVNDLHATVLYLLGIDHLKLTYRFQGRDFRLTDVGGEVVREILA